MKKTHTKCEVILAIPSQNENIYLKLNTMRYSAMDDGKEDITSTQKFFYEEHNCPINLLNDVCEISYEDDDDPHHIIKFISSRDYE